MRAHSEVVGISTSIYAILGRHNPTHNKHLQHLELNIRNVGHRYHWGFLWALTCHVAITGCHGVDFLERGQHSLSCLNHNADMPFCVSGLDPSSVCLQTLDWWSVCTPQGLIVQSLLPPPSYACYAYPVLGIILIVLQVLTH